MAVINKLIITFSGVNDVEINDAITIEMNTGAVTFSQEQTFKSIRTRDGEVTTATTGTLANVNASNLSQSFNLDGTLYGLNATVVDNVVELTLSNESFYFVGATGTLVDDSKVTISSTTSDPIIVKSLEIDSYTAKSPNFCTEINAVLNAIGGNGTYNVYVDNVLTVSSSTSPITVPLTRGNVNSLRVVDIVGDTIGTVTSINPRKVISSDITTNLLNLDAGTTLNINVAYISPYVSPYEYSLDGVTYQETNVFASLPPETYTIYVKDALGCVTTKSVVIDGITELTETIFSISDINPIQFSKYETGKKNYLNTLSCNSLRLKPYAYNQQYLEGDVITTQFKTNAEYINVFTIDKDSNTNTLSAVKRTNNIGLTAKSTSTYFDLGDGKSGIYFGVVDILDPITDNVIGNSDFGFTLPEWANKEGDYVNIEGIGQVEINRIGYSDTYQSFILEFDIAYTGIAVQKKISANYNLQPYEVYEFVTIIEKPKTVIESFIERVELDGGVIEVSECLNNFEFNTTNFPSDFNIVIEVGKSSNDIDFTYVSEKITKVEDSEFLFEVDYWDDKNLGTMVYQTGIKNKLRLYGNVEYIGEQLTEGYDGDTQYYITDNTVYHSERFSFFRVSANIAHKLRLVFAHSNLFINGIQYKLSDSPEIPQGEGNSNIKNFFVTLKSGGNQLLDESQEQITGTSESLESSSLIASAQGKGGLLWTKTL